MGFGCSQEWRVSDNIPPNSFRILQHCSEIQRPACPTIPIPGQLLSFSYQLIVSALYVNGAVTAQSCPVLQHQPPGCALPLPLLATGDLLRI